MSKTKTNKKIKSPLELKKLEIKKKQIDELISPPVPDSRLVITVFTNDKKGLSFKYDTSIGSEQVQNIFSNLSESLKIDILTRNIMKKIGENTERLNRQLLENQLKKEQISKQ